MTHIVRACDKCLGLEPLCRICLRRKKAKKKAVLPTGETPKDKQLWREYRQANGFLGGD
jgi:hypothetical protein